MLPKKLGALFLGNALFVWRDAPDESGLAPTALLIGLGNDRRFVVGFGVVIVDRGGSLGAEVAVPGVEIQGAHTVGAVRAGELHTALDALDSVGFH